MARDVVSSSHDYSIAIHKIEQYSTFLSESMESYVQILNDVKSSGGLDDQNASSRMIDIANMVDPYGNTLLDQIEMLMGYARDFVSEVEDADRFQFPLNVFSVVNTLLDVFF